MTVEIIYEGMDFNPQSLAKAVGLNDGDIEYTHEDAEGWIAIGYKTTPSSTIEEKVKAELAKSGYLKGKKPKEDR